jgi:hypothetical protein
MKIRVEVQVFMRHGISSFALLLSGSLSGLLSGVSSPGRVFFGPGSGMNRGRCDVFQPPDLEGLLLLTDRNLKRPAGDLDVVAGNKIACLAGQGEYLVGQGANQRALHTAVGHRRQECDFGGQGASIARERWPAPICSSWRKLAQLPPNGKPEGGKFRRWEWLGAGPDLAEYPGV